MPALAKAHRAATAGEDEATATANRPVEAQRAAIENVISIPLGDPGWIKEIIRNYIRRMMKLSRRGVPGEPGHLPT
jgi:hypothetical protein